MNSTLPQNPKPFLKWAGGKRALLPYILKYIPIKFKKYYEPFLGSGALFFQLAPEKALLSDLSEDLINTYLQVRNHLPGVIEVLEKMKYEENTYYKIRSTRSTNGIFQAARFIYLNKTCWNGLYRVNSQGNFNVPYGRYENPKICDTENLEKVSAFLKNTHITVADFEDALITANRGDFVYIDPPYTTSHNNNGFIGYNSRIFSINDQIRLRNVFERLCQKGCHVILSNANHKFIRELYKEFRCIPVPRRNTIASDAAKRVQVTELIVTN